MMGSLRSLLVSWTIVSLLDCEVFCDEWHYHSYIEATTDDKHLCLGECELGECVSDWHANKKACLPTTPKQETKYYTTLDNYPCQSNCDKFDKESNEWCVTGVDEWDYCTRSIALRGSLRLTTKNEYVTCSGYCGHHGSSYDWCRTVTRWEECNADDKVFVPYYPTKLNTSCETPCKLYDSDRKAYCYDTNNDWVRCFLNPQYEHVLYSLTRKLRRQCHRKFGNYTSSGFKLCSNSFPRTKRDYDYEDLHFHECDLNVTSVANRHRTNNPSDQVRSVLPDRPITLDTDPILSYTMMPRRVRFGDGGSARDLDLPLVLEAQLTRHTLLPAGARERFRTYVTANYNRMNPNRRGTVADNNYDEQGHILASQLGGPMEVFNIFPQTWRLNHGSGSAWSEMERHMVAFLRNRDDRYIEFLAVLGYVTDSSGRLITRPDHIGVRLRFHENNMLTDRHGNRLNSLEDNETEDMFFSNYPDDDCIVQVASGRL